MLARADAATASSSGQPSQTFQTGFAVKAWNLMEESTGPALPAVADLRFVTLIY